MASCPPDEWISEDALFATMRRGGMSPTIACSKMALWRLYLVDPQYGSLGYDGFHAWEIPESRYTLAVLFEVVLRALARNQQGRPTAQVQRMLWNCRTPLGVRLSTATLHTLVVDITAGRPLELP